MINEYEQYWQKGGAYVLPVEVFNELLEENKHLKDLQNSMDKQYAELENNWNELKKWLIKEHDEFFNRLPDYAIAIENLADKMQEIESGVMIREKEINGIIYYDIDENLFNHMQKLEQENQQLKEEIREEKLSYARLQNTLIEINEDRIIMQQVLDEIREVINKMLYQGYIDGGTQYFATGDKSEFGVRANLLLQILGKVNNMRIGGEYK